MSTHHQPTSIVAAEQHLRLQWWWQAYERVPPRRSRLSDILFLGHFSSWLSQQGLGPGDCTAADLNAYTATLGAFREGVRGGYVRAAHDLVRFIAMRAGGDRDLASAARPPGPTVQG